MKEAIEERVNVRKKTKREKSQRGKTGKRTATMMVNLDGGIKMIIVIGGEVKERVRQGGKRIKSGQRLKMIGQEGKNEKRKKSTESVGGIRKVQETGKELEMKRRRRKREKSTKVTIGNEVELKKMNIKRKNDRRRRKRGKRRDHQKRTGKNAVKN